MLYQGVTMSEYRRFFSYIYAYEQNQKTSNAGFAKIEMKGPMTTIELHMRGIASQTPAACLYLFVRNDDSILGFPLGDVPFSNGTADRRFTLGQPELGESNYRILDAAGILLFADDHICFVSQWDEAPIDWNSFRIYKPEDTSMPEPDDVLADVPSPESGGDTTGKNVIQSTELPQSQQMQTVFAAVTAPPSKEPEDRAFDENPVPDESFSERKRTATQGSWAKTWQKLIRSLPVIQPFSNEDIHCVRVELKDLRLLPPSNWHLCNNSFLLHAFFTYRHLIFGEIPSAKEHKWFIGVPGIRYRQEHVLAAIFGFSDFLPDKESSDADTPFGYWVVSMTEAD